MGLSCVQLCLLSALAARIGCQILHSVDRMSKALDSFDNIADKLELVIAEEQQRLKDIEKYIN